MHEFIIEPELFKFDQAFGFVDIYSLATALLSKYSHHRNGLPSPLLFFLGARDPSHYCQKFQIRDQEEAHEDFDLPGSV